MLGDDAVEALDILEGTAHEHRIGDALAVVGEDAHLRPRAGHRPQGRELLALQPLGDGSDGANLDPVGRLTQVQHLVDDRGGVLRGRRVGHRVHCRVASRSGRACAGKDGLGVLAARLTQVRVDVDEAGQGDQALGVDNAGVSYCVAGLGTDGDDDTS